MHIQIGLRTACIEQDIGFGWLGKRSMDPVGFKRIDKETGREARRE